MLYNTNNIYVKIQEHPPTRAGESGWPSGNIVSVHILNGAKKINNMAVILAQTKRKLKYLNSKYKKYALLII